METTSACGRLPDSELAASSMRSGVLRQLLLSLFVLFFAFTHQAHADSAAEVSTQSDFHLKGVLLSESQRSALVNNTVLREGERLGRAEILAIRQGEVQIRMGSRQLTVLVGSRANWAQAARFEPSSPVLRGAESSSFARYGPVKQGETLSEITQSLLPGDVTMNQMMVALYDANPNAFVGNINVLREGASLRIPDQELLRRRAPAAATAEVVRQMDAWHEGHAPQIRLARAPDPEIYGPVERGETLSGIAAGLPRGDTTLNQLIIALFEANPSAFDDNINILRAGTVLRLPDEATLLRHSHESATAAVSYHLAALRQDDSQLARPAIIDDDLADDDRTASNDTRTQLPDRILVAIQNSE